MVQASSCWCNDSTDIDRLFIHPLCLALMVKSAYYQYSRRWIFNRPINLTCDEGPLATLWQGHLCLQFCAAFPPLPPTGWRNKTSNRGDEMETEEREDCWINWFECCQWPSFSFSVTAAKWSVGPKTHFLQHRCRLRRLAHTPSLLLCPDWLATPPTFYEKCFVFLVK